MDTTPNSFALRSVREQRRLAITDVAEFSNISPKKLAEFEAGENEPTLKQVERLAELYGVSSFLLFGGQIPNVEEALRDYRTADMAPARVTARGLRTILRAERVARFAFELSIALPPLRPSWSLPAGTGVTKARAAELRMFFDEWFAKRAQVFALTGSPAHTHLTALKLFFEAQGGVASVNEAPPEDYLGFYTQPEVGYPAIFVNRCIASKKAQLFTFVHEWAHSLTDAEGISDPFLTKNPVERRCNKFAAEFLAPLSQLRMVADEAGRAARADVFELVSHVSSRTLLSHHATAVRLFEAGYITQSALNRWVATKRKYPSREKDEEKSLSPVRPGGVPHAKQISEIGHLPVYLAGRARELRILDSLDIKHAIGLSESVQEKAFALSAKRYEAALS